MASVFVKLPLVSGGGGGGGAVDSFNGRVGNVVSQAGDYSASIVSNTPAGTIAATTVQAAINELNSDAVALTSTVSTLATDVAGKQPLDAELTAIAAISTNGFIARTSAGTAAARTLTAGTNIAVTNADGVSGNPTVALTGTVAPANGGTGVATTPGPGQVLIGTGSVYQVGFLSAGSGISIINTPGGIQIVNTAMLSSVNIDGGNASSVYGGTGVIDGGNA